MSEKTVIDLSPHTDGGRVRNLAGKDKGLDVRAAERLDELDAQGGEVEVIVPDFIDAIAPSFFLGLFSRSISRFGSREAFLNHYRFRCSELIAPQIDDGINDYFRARSSIDQLLGKTKRY
jgi:hypothetical protein